MRILVAGGTGFIGEALCRELHERGHEVTALARNPENADLPDGVERVMGDVTAYDSIEAAFEGQDAVVNLVALAPLFRPSGGNEMHFEVHLGGTENVVRAAETHDVKKIVQMSALGADPNSDIAYIRAKGQAETVVRESDLEWVIFRPTVVFGDGEDFVHNTKRLLLPYLTLIPGGGKTRFQPIYVGEFVPMMADAIEGETSETGISHVGKTYEIGGPEVLTLADVAKLAYAAEGKSATVVPIPMAVAKIGMTTLDFVPTAVLDVLPGVPRVGSDQYRSLKLDSTIEDNDIEAFGVSPEELTTLASYLGVEDEA